MFRLFASCFCVALVATSGFGQTSELAVKRVELISPIDHSGEKPKFVGSRYDRSCLDLVRVVQGCRGGEMVSYGNRFGKNWDIFSVSGERQSRTRMIDLGAYDWSDRINIQEIEPWPALKDGESRHITINGSGADGEDGKPGHHGMNADGTMPLEPSRQAKPKRAKQTIDYGNSPISVQVSSTVTMRGKVPVPSTYNPFTEVIKGHMYLIRVVDGENDHYILMRVDDLVRGEKVSISYYRFPVAL